LYPFYVGQPSWKTNHITFTLNKMENKMTITAQIKCINKTNRYDPYDRIDYVGGVNADGTRWRMSQPDAVKGVENGTYSFYVSQNGRTVNVIVAKSAAGHKYLKTAADDIQPNNLLSLPDCPQ
jgi:hypothetical protein